MNPILTGLMVGAAGSLHCLGMCSPLILAVTSGRSAWKRKLIYNLGRLLMYGVLGFAAASLGNAFEWLGFGKYITLLAGIVLLATALSGTGLLKISTFEPLLLKASGWMRSLFQPLIVKKTDLSVVALGMVNGMIPCGLSYAAVVTAMTFGQAWQGSLYMLSFGMGTLLTMQLTVGFAGNFLSGLRSKSPWLRPGRVTTIMLLVAGVFLIGKSIRVFESEKDFQSNAVTAVPDCH
ncbi:MAG: sulfite exporter TauE/SafE family protein [Bacteroidetes bacterium]|nr:sulfite exporter TauE/SafE family protein [Bacteroidota bacterium]